MKKQLNRQDCRIRCIALKMKPDIFDMFRSGGLDFCYSFHRFKSSQLCMTWQIELMLDIFSLEKNYHKSCSESNFGLSY
jgi:hypothetical protein